MEFPRRNRVGFFLRKYNFFLLLIFFWGFVYLLLLGNNSLLSRLNLQSKMSATSQDIRRLGRENQVLKDQIGKIKNDREHMEFLARKLGYISPGEVVYKFDSTPPVGAGPVPGRVPAFESFIRGNVRFIIIGLAALSFVIVWIGFRLRERAKQRKI